MPHLQASMISSNTQGEQINKAAARFTNLYFPILFEQTDCKVRGGPTDSFLPLSKELQIIIQSMLALALVLYQIYEHSFGAMW